MHTKRVFNNRCKIKYINNLNRNHSILMIRSLAFATLFACLPLTLFGLGISGFEEDCFYCASTGYSWDNYNGYCEKLTSSSLVKTPWDCYKYSYLPLISKNYTYPMFFDMTKLKALKINWKSTSIFRSVYVGLDNR